MRSEDSACRLVVLVDATAPATSHDALYEALLATKAWCARWSYKVELRVAAFGAGVAWMKSGATFARSAEIAALSTTAPDLALALQQADIRNPDAVVVVMHREPADGWKPSSGSVACTVVTSNATPPSSTGTGMLGPTFDAAHALHALQWSICDALDRSNLTGLRMRVGDRIVSLFPGQQLWPHHVGNGLSFDAPLAQVVRHSDGVRLGLRNLGTVAWTSDQGDCPSGKAWTLREGLRFAIRDTTVAVRDAPPRVPTRFRVTPVRANPGLCDGCDGRLHGPYAQLPPDPRQYCQLCIERHDLCDFCHLPLGTKGEAWPDGRMACPVCRHSAIIHQRDLEALAGYARKWLSGKLAMHTDSVPLHFADAPTIAAMHGRTFQRTPDGSPREAGFYRHKGEKGIWIEHAAPRNYVFGVLVHEWTHVWHVPRLPDAPILLSAVEGLAMWTEWHALTDVGAVVEAHRATLMGGPYGEGLQMYRALEQELGFSSVPRVDPRIFN